MSSSSSPSSLGGWGRFSLDRRSRCSTSFHSPTAEHEDGHDSHPPAATTAPRKAPDAERQRAVAVALDADSA